MNWINKKLKFFLAIVFVAIGFLFYFRHQVYFSHGFLKDNKIFEIQKGEGNAQIASNLQKEGIISNKIYFYYYLRTHSLANKLLPGNYQLSGNLTIPEVASVITEKKDEFWKITFPEGWTAKQMAERLTKNNLPGEDFLAVAQNPPVELLAKFYFLSDLPRGKNLEGYLFPDTYFFSAAATGSGIVQKMLNNFGEKVSPVLIQEAKEKNRSLFEIVTMASILEGEVRSESDRQIVSGLFWDRIKNEQALQSCATVAFVLGEKKAQYSFEDTRVISPYNTYLNKGLIPGPISNPGMISISTALRPAQTDYNYFLSDPETGQTIFSKTLDEHNSNKIKYGL